MKISGWFFGRIRCRVDFGCGDFKRARFGDQPRWKDISEGGKQHQRRTRNTRVCGNEEFAVVDTDAGSRATRAEMRIEEAKHARRCAVPIK